VAYLETATNGFLTISTSKDKKPKIKADYYRLTATPAKIRLYF